MTKDVASVSILSDDWENWRAYVDGVDCVYGWPIEVRAWGLIVNVQRSFFSVQFQLTQDLIAQCMDDSIADIHPAEWHRYLVNQTHRLQWINVALQEPTDYVNEFKFCCIAARAAVKAVYTHRANSETQS